MMKQKCLRFSNMFKLQENFLSLLVSLPNFWYIQENETWHASKEKLGAQNVSMEWHLVVIQCESYWQKRVEKDKIVSDQVSKWKNPNAYLWVHQNRIEYRNQVGKLQEVRRAGWPCLMWRTKNLLAFGYWKEQSACLPSSVRDHLKCTTQWSKGQELLKQKNKEDGHYEVQKGKM